MTLSARNHLKGKIEEIQKGDVLVHVTVRVATIRLNRSSRGDPRTRWRSRKATRSRQLSRRRRSCCRNLDIHATSRH
jgi:hypothetical protein